MSADRHPSGWKHYAGYCPSTVVDDDRWYCNRTIKRDGLCEIHASAADRAKARGGFSPATYAQLRAERDELAATVARVRALAEHYAGLTNVDAGGIILRALGGA